MKNTLRFLQKIFAALGFCSLLSIPAVIFLSANSGNQSAGDLVGFFVIPIGLFGALVFGGLSAIIIFIGDRQKKIPDTKLPQKQRAFRWYLFTPILIFLAFVLFAYLTQA